MLLLKRLAFRFGFLCIWLHGMRVIGASQVALRISLRQVAFAVFRIRPMRHINRHASNPKNQDPNGYGV